MESVSIFFEDEGPGTRLLQDIPRHGGKRDSSSTIPLDLSKNSMYHSRTKHIDIRYHWIRDGATVVEACEDPHR